MTARTGIRLTPPKCGRKIAGLASCPPPAALLDFLFAQNVIVHLGFCMYWHGKSAQPSWCATQPASPLPELRSVSGQPRSATVAFYTPTPIHFLLSSSFLQIWFCNSHGARRTACSDFITAVALTHCASNLRCSKIAGDEEQVPC
jgi:hypothetical protein